jgi:hypothetical protein
MKATCTQEHKSDMEGDEENQRRGGWLRTCLPARSPWPRARVEVACWGVDVAAAAPCPWRTPPSPDQKMGVKGTTEKMQESDSSKTEENEFMMPSCYKSMNS